MSLATDFLADYLERFELSQSDFARGAGVPASNLTEILKGSVEISWRNVEKLLNGIREPHEKDGFLAAYLRDSIPRDMADRVHVHLSRPKEPGMVEEESANEIENDLVVAFAALPNDTYRRQLVRFMQQLRRDADLRDLFRRTMEYVEDGLLMQRDESRSTRHEIHATLEDAPTADLPPAAKAKKKKA